MNRSPSLCSRAMTDPLPRPGGSRRRASRGLLLTVLTMLSAGACTGVDPLPGNVDAGTLDGGGGGGGCLSAAECDDGDPCNGAETCNPDGTCLAATLPGEGVACTTEDDREGLCTAGVCAPVGCGNGVVEEGEVCDDGNRNGRDGCTPECQYSCVRDADCADANVCNGRETCNTDTHRCERDEAPDCRDGNPCTEDQCDPARGCRHRLIDEDGDGHAPSAIGACGDDCDDADPNTYEGAPEICDPGNVDNDCDGSGDDAGAQIWWRDCDGDGYAVESAPSVVQCERPSPPSCGGVNGTWTTREPASELNNVDCNDNDPSRHPRATEIIDDGIDQDCDGGERCYLDSDRDGYRTAATTTSIGDLDCTDAGEARASTPTGDCCEIDDRVHPLLEDYEWYTEPHACADSVAPNRAYDYDCDDLQENEIELVSSTCLLHADGVWRDEIPACGERGAYYTACNPEVLVRNRDSRCR